MKHLLIASILLSFAMGATATAAADQSGANTTAFQASVPQPPTRFEDPDTYADDICWVAPEWRDD